MTMVLRLGVGERLVETVIQKLDSVSIATTDSLADVPHQSLLDAWEAIESAQSDHAAIVQATGVCLV